MAIKLLVRLVDETRAPTEYAFDDKSVIIIGRDSAADLTLYDEDMMVSREHARLELMGDTYYLTDLGSRNFSFIKGDRLNPGQGYPLNADDIFHIANYEVQLKIEAAPAIDFGVTRFDAGFTNPFLDHVKMLEHALEAIQIEHEKLPDVRKEAALSEALSDAAERFKDNPVFQYLSGGSHGISGGAGAAPSLMQPPSGVSPPVAQPPAATPAPAVSQPPPAPAPVVSPPPPASPPLDISLDEGSSKYLRFFANDPTRLDLFMNVLMDYVSKQVKVPWQFKYEFIGHTFMPTADSKAIYESDAEGLADFLFDESCDKEKLDHRFDLIRDALSEGLLHQMAILDGYRAAVDAGTKLMIGELDPAKVLAGLDTGNALKKRLVFLSQSEAFEIMLQKHSELAAEDVSVIERRTYRPAFIKSYLERTASG